jgi:hypothetical protein
MMSDFLVIVGSQAPVTGFVPGMNSSTLFKNAADAVVVNACETACI